MRKEIREIMQQQWSQARGRADRLADTVRSVQEDLANLRGEYNEAENLVRLIEEELQRPDGSPLTEGGGQPVAEIAGSGI